jgi:hypothetical protein
MFEVWQSLAPFGGRPIGGAIEALLTKAINWQSSVLPIVVVFVATSVTQPNSAESIILLAGGAETMMLSVLALRVSILSALAESIILSVTPAESMILSVPPADANRKHTGTVRRQCVVP